MTENKVDPSVSVVVPWRAQPDRQRGWDWLKRWYQTHHPDWEIVEADCPTKEWNKPTAVNLGVQQARGDVVIVADADVMPAKDILATATRHALATSWVVPHGKVHRLRRQVTADLRAQDPATVTKIPTGPLVRPAYNGMVGGGLLVISKKNFLAMGGFDPGFKLWGSEDTCFGIAADTLLGKHLRYTHIPLIHLWHVPGSSVVNPYYSANTRRKRLYQVAQRSRRAMAALRDVPVPQSGYAPFPRPEPGDSMEDWKLYVKSAGVRVPRNEADKKEFLIARVLRHEQRASGIPLFADEDEDETDADDDPYLS